MNYTSIPNVLWLLNVICFLLQISNFNIVIITNVVIIATYLDQKKTIIFYVPHGTLLPPPRFGRTLFPFCIMLFCNHVFTVRRYWVGLVFVFIRHSLSKRCKITLSYVHRKYLQTIPQSYPRCMILAVAVIVFLT